MLEAAALVGSGSPMIFFFSFWFPVIDFWRWALCPPHQILINNDIVGEADVLSVSGKCFFTPQKIYYGGGY
jgi:hypothetical protein